MGIILLLFVFESAYGISITSTVNGVANALNPLNILKVATVSAGNGIWGALTTIALLALVAYVSGFAISSMGLENLLMAGAFLVFMLLII